MTELPQALAARIARTAAICLAACAQHADLLETQRAALRFDDSELLASLAEESAELLASVERQTRFPPEIRRALQESTGPRATRAREQLDQIRRQASQAEAAIHELTEVLATRKIALLRELGALTSAGPGWVLTPPTALDVTG